MKTKNNFTKFAMCPIYNKKKIKKNKINKIKMKKIKYQLRKHIR